MKVLLTYFKPSGTYYSDGEYESEQRFPWDVHREVRDMRQRGKLPGLTDGSREWHISVDCPEYKHNIPHLIPLDLWKS